jgi:hypothetical protein
MEFKKIGACLAIKSDWVVNEISDFEIQVKVPLEGERSQHVRVSQVGKFDAQGIQSEVLEFHSVSVEVPKGQMITPKLAYDLLKTNARMMFGAWGIGEQDGKQYLAIYDSALLATLTPDDLIATVTVLATEADRLEHDWDGQDIF